MKTILAFAFMCLSVGPALARNACIDDLRTKYLSGTKLSAADFDACAEARPTPAPRVNSRNNPPAAKTAAADAKEPKPKVRPIPEADHSRTYFLLRKNFNDVGLFDDPTKTNKAAGAEFSYFDDRVAGNAKWSVDAMAAVVFQYINNRYAETDLNFIGITVAPYVHFQRIRNSNPAASQNNLDQVSYGGSAEFGFDMLGGAHYFRATGSGVSDRIDGTTSGSAIFNWFPVYSGPIAINYPFGVPGIPVIFVFEPRATARLDNIVINDVTGAKAHLWRMGAEAVLRYNVFGSQLPWYLQRIHGQTAYSYLLSDTSRPYSLFSTSLTYNVDEDGHIGVTAGYSKGRNEETGRRVDLFKASLTAKW